MVLNIVLFVVGLAMLYYGAEWLVKGSASLAKSLGLSAVVIGLTVVAFGTSAPELVVSVISSLKNKSMIAVGNVVGSNICNIALVLGLCAVMIPITCHPSVLRRDIPIMLGISLFLFLLTMNSVLGRIEGAVLFAGIIAYTVFNYMVAVRESRRASVGASMAAEAAIEASADLDAVNYVSSRGKQIVLILAGLVGVVAGAEILIDAAIKIMKTLGVGEKFIGLTIVAVGTSLPELATSVVAAARRELDISIGNLVGSNVFNIMSVLGAASLVRPIAIPGGFFQSGLVIDYIVMIFIAFLPLVLMRKNYTVGRKGGVLLLCCYAGYIAYLIARG